MSGKYSWKRHFHWIIPLVLIPISFIAFALGSLAYYDDFDSASATFWSNLIGVILVFCVVGVPITCVILTITGAQKAYRGSRRFERISQEKSAAAIRRIEQQIVNEGGPRCDLEARLVAKTQAQSWYETLSRGEQLNSVQSFSLNLEPGESVFDQFRAKYARFYGMNVSYQTGGVFAMGSPLFVAGALIGSAINKSNAKNRAERMAAQQWRELQYVDVLVTDRRFIIPVGGRTLSFYYSATVAFFPRLDAMTLTLDYGDQTEPLQLFSPSVAAASVLLVHQLQGVEGMQNHPSLEMIQRDALTP